MNKPSIDQNCFHFKRIENVLLLANMEKDMRRQAIIETMASCTPFLKNNQSVSVSLPMRLFIESNDRFLFIHRILCGFFSSRCCCFIRCCLFCHLNNIYANMYCAQYQFKLDNGYYNEFCSLQIESFHLK